jgi:hypothetical protein
MATINQCDPSRLAEAFAPVQLRHQFGECAGGLHAGRPPADHDDVDGARDAGGLVIDRHPQQVSQMDAQAFRVCDRVQGECVLGRAGDAEEVRARAGRQHQVRPVKCRAVGEHQASGAEIDPRDLGGHDLDLWMLLEDGPMRPGDVLGRQLRTRHLVEQRLELVVVVAIDEDHAGACGLRLFRARDAREATAEDQDPLRHVTAPLRCLARRP